MRDGNVVTQWHAVSGGDSSAVQAEVKQATIYSTSWAFAAKMRDEIVVAWGQADYGGDSSTV